MLKTEYEQRHRGCPSSSSRYWNISAIQCLRVLKDGGCRIVFSFFLVLHGKLLVTLFLSKVILVEIFSIEVRRIYSGVFTKGTLAFAYFRCYRASSDKFHLCYPVVWDIIINYSDNRTNKNIRPNSYHTRDVWHKHTVGTHGHYKTEEKTVCTLKNYQQIHVIWSYWIERHTPNFCVTFVSFFFLVFISFVI